MAETAEYLHSGKCEQIYLLFAKDALHFEFHAVLSTLEREKVGKQNQLSINQHFDPWIEHVIRFTPYNH